MLPDNPGSAINATKSWTNKNAVAVYRALTLRMKPTNRNPAPETSRNDNFHEFRESERTTDPGHRQPDHGQLDGCFHSDRSRQACSGFY